MHTSSAPQRALVNLDACGSFPDLTPRLPAHAEPASEFRYRNAVVERDLYPRVAKRVQLLRGLDFDRAPGLTGIIPLKLKPLAELILRTHVGDPLLVRGRRGLGRTAAFASDAQPRWAARWVAWEGFGKFWSQLARDTMRQGAGTLGGATLRVTPGADEGSYSGVVDVDAAEGFVNDLHGELLVIDPSQPQGSDAHTARLPISLTAPGRYEASVLGVHAGQRLLKAELFDDGPTLVSYVRQRARLRAQGWAIDAIRLKVQRKGQA